MNNWPHNSLDHIPDESWQRARERVEAEHLGLFDIGALSLAELADIDDPADESRLGSAERHENQRG